MAGRDHVGPGHPDRGPCTTTTPTGEPCGHLEETHDHLRSSGADDCGICGPDECPTYRPPSGKRCARCGVPQRSHANLNPHLATLMVPGVCPTWVRPAPAWMKTLNRALAALPLP